MVDYHILEQFVTFYQTGTLRETAEKMHISQPTLTRNMQRLETEFDVPLFHRTKNSISLNETGTLAAEDAKMLITAHPAQPPALLVVWTAPSRGILRFRLKAA